MSRGRIKAILFIIVFLLLAAVVISWLSGLDDRKSDPSSLQVPDVTIPEAQESLPVAENTPVPVISSAPQSTPVPVSTPSPTPAPTPTPAAPTPTPAPTPSPVPAGVSLGSGSFRSETGTGLNLVAEWSARTVGSNQAEVTVKVSADSYSLYLSSMTGSINLSLGEQYTTMDQPAVQYDGRDKINTVFGTKTFTVTLPDSGSLSLPLAVEWHYRGSYGDTALDVIECGGSVALNR